MNSIYQAERKPGAGGGTSLGPPLADSRRCWSPSITCDRGFGVRGAAPEWTDSEIDAQKKAGGGAMKTKLLKEI